MPNDPPKETATSEEITEKPESSLLLAGITQGFLDGNSHFGVAVTVSSGTGLSTLMVPDVTNKEPAFITRPITLDGKKLQAFFTKKSITLPASVGNLLADTTISCEAFYYSKDTMLLMFEIKFNEGLIASLTGDADLGTLFDVKGASLRIIRCKGEESLKILRKYVASLSPPSA